MLEEMWPEYVTTKWRFGRPQHFIKKNWKCFTHPLKRRKDIDWKAIEKSKPILKLKKVRPIKTEAIEKYYKSNLRKERKDATN